MAKQKLMPLADRVIVEPAKEPQSAAGIIIPDTAGTERPGEGIVVAVGKGKIGDDNERIPMEVSVGDRVVFAKYGPETVTVDKKEYYILREDQILAVIK